jgi:hypothetical protein
MKSLVCCILILAATSPLAWPVNLTANDAPNTTSFNSAGNWDSGAAPSAGNDYSTRGYLLRTPSTPGNYTFDGNSLTVGGGDGGGANPFLTDGQVNLNAFMNKTPGNPTITVNNLILDGGYIRDGMGSSDSWTLAGNIYVTPYFVTAYGGGGIQNQCRLNIDSVISGNGTLIIGNSGSGEAARTTYINSPLNTYCGSIYLKGSNASNCRLTFSQGSRMNFVIGQNRSSNSITGYGTLILNGDFHFDLSGASTHIGDYWTIAYTASRTCGSTFAVKDFEDVGGGNWEKAANGIIYQFSESTGLLTACSPYPGSGTLEDPYQISTAEQMNTIGANSDKVFKLMADIDMSCYTGTQYNIIGNESMAFTGVFDGNGHVIRNLTYTVPDYVSYAGLFGWMSGTVRNLGLENVSISGGSYVGALAGYNSGTIESCYSTGIVGGSDSAAAYCVGGLVGYSAGYIEWCYSWASAGRASYAGGLTGIDGGEILCSYSTGSVSGSYAGGLVGTDYYVDASISCFWDTETSGQTFSEIGTGKTTAEMKITSTFTGWDPAYWALSNSGYPRLAWEQFIVPDVVGQTLADATAAIASAGFAVGVVTNVYDAAVPAGHVSSQSLTAGTIGAYGSSIALTVSIGQRYGSGSSDDPYQIWTAEQMNDVGAHPGDWDKCFRLMADVDMSGYTGTQYNIIGTDSSPFSGTFDGNGHVIRNLTYTGAVNYVGFFGYVTGAVRDLGLKDVSLSTTGNNVGGLVGFNYGMLTRCYSTGSVSGGYGNVGGLAGGSSGAMITDCYSAGSVNGVYNVGGLAGGCFAGTITDCYSSASASGTTNVGGLAGGCSSSVTRCYSTGAVTGTSYVGGFAGRKDYHSITACFWDTQTSGQPGSDGGTGLTTVQMKTASTFIDAGWDFSEADGDAADWGMPYHDYPRLSWQPYHNGGSGSAGDPYRIWTAAQLNTIGATNGDWGSCFKLMADIDMSGYTGTQYNIIGTQTMPFAGTFDGNGHVVRNLTYTTTDGTGYVGMFGSVSGAIRDLGLEGVSLSTGGSWVGGLAGDKSGTVTNCFVRGGSVSGDWAVGGLVGNNQNGSIDDCYATDTVHSAGAFSGGLVGRLWVGSLSRCYSTGAVTGVSYVGGFAGWNFAASFSACFWDTESSGQSVSVGGTGLDTAAMKDRGTFETAGWDFAGDVWRLCQSGSAYPRLAWEFAGTGDLACPDGVDYADLSAFADKWLAEGGLADISGDGIVNFHDFATLASHWMATE